MPDGGNPVAAPGTSKEEEAQGVLGFFEGVLSLSRDLKHNISDRALDAKEFCEKEVSNHVQGLLTGQDMTAIGSDAAPSQQSAAERWWCQACHIVHKNHSVDLEATSRPPHARGSLEVKFLGFASSPPLRRETSTLAGALQQLSGEAPTAVEPVCQLGFDGTLTGALHPANDLRQDGEHPETCDARFYFTELAGSDLSVNVFDRKARRFQLGFEDAGFCGGAFVPVGALLQRGDVMATSFEAVVRVKLLPLACVRSKCKLREASEGQVHKLKAECGHLFLSLKLTLDKPWPKLVADLPYCPSARAAVAPHGHIADPMSILKSAGSAVGRLGKALTLIPPKGKQSVLELREIALFTICSQAWWALWVLTAPVALWPFFFVATAVGVIFQIRRVEHAEAYDSVLYIEEIPVDPSTGDLNALDMVMESAKGAAKVQVTIMNLTESVNGICEVVEKTKHALYFGSPYVCAAVCAGLLAVSVGLGAWLQLLIYLAGWGLLRPLIWFPGACGLMSGSTRLLLIGALEKGKVFIEQFLNPENPIKARAAFSRAPDALEGCHYRLCHKYAFEFSSLSGASAAIGCKEETAGNKKDD